MAAPKAKLAFRGRDRHMVKKIQQTLAQIRRMDQRRSDAATKNGVPGLTYQTGGTSNVTGAITQLIDRCTSALNQRVSAQAVPPVAPQV